MGWPVVLVVDVSGQAQSAAATALGFQAYRPDLPFAGVILNRVASPRHERLARLGMEQAGIKVLGCLPRRGDLVLPERHLGLIQAVEHPDLDAAIAGYADFLRAHVDLAALRDAARGNQGIVNEDHCPQPPPDALRWRRMRRFPLPIRISWRDGVLTGRKSCRFPHWPTRPPTQAPIWSGCRGLPRTARRTIGGGNPFSRRPDPPRPDTARAWRMRRVYGAWHRADRQGRHRP